MEKRCCVASRSENAQRVGTVRGVCNAGQEMKTEDQEQMERQLPDELKSLRQGSIERDAPHTGKNKLANGSIAGPLSVCCQGKPQENPPTATSTGCLGCRERTTTSERWTHLAASCPPRRLLKYMTIFELGGVRTRGGTPRSGKECEDHARTEKRAEDAP